MIPEPFRKDMRVRLNARASAAGIRSGETGRGVVTGGSRDGHGVQVLFDGLRCAQGISTGFVEPRPRMTNPGRSRGSAGFPGAGHGGLLTKGRSDRDRAYPRPEALRRGFTYVGAAIKMILAGRSSRLYGRT